MELMGLGDPDTWPHWQALRRGELVVQRCTSCGRYRWQPRAICHVCRSWRHEWVAVSGHGRLYAWTVTHKAPAGYGGPVPYAVGMVQLIEQDDLMMVGRLDSPVGLGLYAGMPVQAAVQNVDDSSTVVSWRPVPPEAG
jgi:uncharacterized OB-fold protein